MVTLRRLLTGVRGAVRPGVLVTGGVAASAVAVVIAATVPGGGGTCNLNATTANFSAQLTAATAGQTLCLATGNYGTFTGAAKSSPGVTIKPQSGATPQLDLNFGASPTPAWLILDGLTIDGGLVSAPAHDVTIKNSAFTGTTIINPNSGPANNNLCSSCPAMNNNNLTFGPGNTFNNITPGAGYEGRIEILNTGTNPSGVRITGNTFSGGLSDGIQMSTGNGAVTVDSNVFSNIVDCRDNNSLCADPNNSPHTDGVQITDIGNLTFSGNLLSGTSTGIVGYDGNNSGNTFTNNVVTGTLTASKAMILGGIASPTVTHNTIRGTADFTSKSGQTSTNITLRDNIIKDGIAGSNGVGGNATFTVSDYSLCVSACAGAHSVTGSATWTGGANPTSFAGFALSGGSAGKGVASDGTDIGVNP